MYASTSFQDNNNGKGEKIKKKNKNKNTMKPVWTKLNKGPGRY